MTPTVLYRKWRPLIFDDVIGQSHITDTLKNQLKQNRTSHAYLFTGTRGTGKTSCAKILARAINCEHPEDGNPCNKCPSCLGILNSSILDVLEMDAASNNGVDNIRDILDEAVYTPASVKKRVYIIDEVHMLSTGAFNALLKTLEEPPEHVLFILATTEIHKVPATILSRCQRFDFRRIPAEEILHALQNIASREGLTAGDDALLRISALAEGSMRDALSVFERCISGKTEITLADVNESLGLIGSEYAIRLMNTIAQNDSEAALSIFQSLYHGGRDIGTILDELLSLCRDLLIVKNSKELAKALVAPGLDKKELFALADSMPGARILSLVSMIQETLSKLPRSAGKRVEIELCLIRMCSGASDDLSGLVARVDALEKQLSNASLNPDITLSLNTPRPTQETQHPTPTPQPEVKAALISGHEAKAPNISPASPTKPEVPSKASPAASEQDFTQYLEALKGKLSTPAYMHLKLSRLTLSEESLDILVEDDLARMLLNDDHTKNILTEAAKQTFKRSVPVRVRLDEADTQIDPKLNNILNLARKNGVEVHIQ